MSQSLVDIPPFSRVHSLSKRFLGDSGGSGRGTSCDGVRRGRLFGRICSGKARQV